MLPSRLAQIARISQRLSILALGAVLFTPVTAAAQWVQYAFPRSMYSSANGVFWAAGTNATATRLP